VGCRWFAVLVALSLALALVPVTTAQETTKVVVLQQAKFTNLTSYMYDTGTKALSAVDSTKVSIFDYQLEDKDATDSYVPAVVLTLGAPSRDLNTNETIVYAWVLSGATGTSAIIAVVDINTTTVTSIQFYKVSPVSGDVAVFRTSYDIVIEVSNYKLSIPLSGFTDPKVMVMTDSSVVVTGLSYLELRALANPPAGYTLVRSGSGESEFTISASGRLSVWFDEEHDTGDVDLFAFDQSHPRYSAVSVSRSWADLVSAVFQDQSRATYVFADAGPGTGTITATGTVKFIVKRYSGDATGVSWRVACRLDTAPQPTQTTTPTQTAPQTATGVLRELWGTVQTALSNQSVLLVIVGLLFLLLLVALLRR